MNEFSNNSKKPFTRESIIGLGEDSFKKSYYPELQQKITVLEQMQARNDSLMAAMQDILLVSNKEQIIEPFAALKNEQRPLQQELLTNNNIIELLKDGVEKAKIIDPYEVNFQIKFNYQLVYLEARFKKTQTGEVLIMIRDMTAILQMQHTLRDMLERDFLTKTYNRTWFEQRLSSYMGKSHRNLILITFNVNSLQFINNTLGHVHGDQILVESSKLLNETFSKICQIARVGGDGFAGIVENCDVQTMEKHIAHFVEANEHYNKTHTSHVLISVGYSHHNEGIVNTEIMYQEADNKMHQSSLKNFEAAKKMHIQTFINALEKMRHLTSSGSKQAELLAEHMAHALSFSPKKRANLKLLSQFYDIGKIGVPESILNKTTPLNTIEWNLVRSHSVVGERIVSEVSELKHLAPLILKHHERWNGSGYPLGLFKTDIPLECRIIHIIDSFTAMTSNRPHRKALTFEQARSEISTGSGTLYDPKLVVLFLSIIDKNPEI